MQADRSARAGHRWWNGRHPTPSLRVATAVASPHPDVAYDAADAPLRAPERAAPGATGSIGRGAE
jgi:hypothetical protein